MAIPATVGTQSHGPPCRGRLASSPAIGMGELAVFEESNATIEFEAIENAGFIYRFSG